MTSHPVLLAVTPAAAPQASGTLAPGADPRSLHLAEALARLQDQAKTIRTPAALASDLLAEALLQRRYGQPAPDAAAASAQPGPAPDAVLTPAPEPAYAPQGRPGPLQVAPTPQGDPAPQGDPVPQGASAPQVPPAVSLSPGVPALSAPAGTAIAVPVAASPAAGTALAAAPPPQVLEAARAAIARGADPERVRARLAAHGYDAGAL